VLRPRIILRVRIVIALALGLEVVLGVESLARFVGIAAAYDGVVWLLTALRALVTAAQAAAAWALLERRPPATFLTTAAVLSSATLLTLEIGGRLAPNSLPPGTQWPTVAAYWLYAAIVVFLVRRLSG
jgi:hypothetical protein